MTRLQLIRCIALSLVCRILAGCLAILFLGNACSPDDIEDHVPDTSPPKGSNATPDGKTETEESSTESEEYSDTEKRDEDVTENETDGDTGEYSCLEDLPPHYETFIPPPLPSSPPPDPLYTQYIRQIDDPKQLKEALACIERRSAEALDVHKVLSTFLNTTYEYPEEAKEHFMDLYASLAEKNPKVPGVRVPCDEPCGHLQAPMLCFETLFYDFIKDIGNQGSGEYAKQLVEKGLVTTEGQAPGQPAISLYKAATTFMQSQHSDLEAAKRQFDILWTFLRTKDAKLSDKERNKLLQQDQTHKAHIQLLLDILNAPDAQPI